MLSLVNNNSSHLFSNKIDVYTLHVVFSNNNITITLISTFTPHRTVFSISSGWLKFKGKTKTGSVAVESLALIFIQQMKAQVLNCTLLFICFSGISFHKKAFLEKLLKSDLKIKYISIKQIIKIAHNGCKLPKIKRG